VTRVLASRPWYADARAFDLAVPLTVLVTLSEADERHARQAFERGRPTVPRLFTSRRAVDYPMPVIVLEGAP
jgi:hypothetical protein